MDNLRSTEQCDPRLVSIPFHPNPIESLSVDFGRLPEVPLRMAINDR